MTDLLGLAKRCMDRALYQSSGDPTLLLKEAAAALREVAAHNDTTTPLTFFQAANRCMEANAVASGFGLDEVAELCAKAAKDG
jgi:hypothetical protein